MRKACCLPTSSLLQLPSEQSIDSPCARCKGVNVDCVLDDYSKRSKIELLTRQQISSKPLMDIKQQQPQLEQLGSQLLLSELTRQVSVYKCEAKKSSSGNVQAASIDDLDTLIDEQAFERLSEW